jgi:hypothetical protein
LRKKVPNLGEPQWLSRWNFQPELLVTQDLPVHLYLDPVFPCVIPPRSDRFDGVRFPNVNRLTAAQLPRTQLEHLGAGLAVGFDKVDSGKL